MNRLRRLLGGSSGPVIVIMLGSGLGQLVVLLVQPLITRLYTPAENGLFTTFTALSSVFGTFVLFRLDAAIPLPRKDRVAAAVAWLALGVSTATALIIGLLGPLIAGPLSRLLNSPELADVWWLVVAATFMIAFDQVLLTWMVREKRYTALAVRNGLQGIGTAVGQVVLGLTAIRNVGLLVGWIIGRIAAVGGLFSAGGLVRQGRPNRHEVVAAASRYRRFPLIASWSALINSLGQYVPWMVIGAYYGNTVLGLFGLTVRVFAAPAALIGQAVTRVFQGEASSAIRTRERALRPIVVSNVRMLLIIGTPVTLVIALAGPWLFGVVFGAEWAEAGQYARVLAIGYLAQLAVSPVSATMGILERQGAQLGWDIFRLAVTTLAPIVAASRGASATVTMAVLSGSWVLCYGVLYLVCTAAAGRHDRLHPIP